MKSILVLFLIFCLIAPSFQQRYFLSYDFFNPGDRSSNTFFRLGRCLPYSKLNMNNPPIIPGSPPTNLGTSLPLTIFFTEGTYTKFWCAGSNGQLGYICNYPTLDDCIGDVRVNELCYEMKYTGFSSYCVYDYTPIVNEFTGDNVPDSRYVPHQGPFSMTTYKYIPTISQNFSSCDSSKCDLQVNYAIYTQDPQKTCVPSDETTVDGYFIRQTRCVPPPVQPTTAVQTPTTTQTPTPVVQTPEIKLYKGDCSIQDNLHRTYSDLKCVNVDVSDKTKKSTFTAAKTTAVPTPTAKAYKSLVFNNTKQRLYFYPQVNCAGTAVGAIVANQTACATKNLTQSILIEGVKVVRYLISK